MARKTGDSGIMARLGHIIRNYRTAQGLTQKELAQRAGVDPRYIGFAEQGRLNMTIKSMQAIANGLDVPLCELCPGDTNPQSRPKHEKSAEQVLRERIVKALNHTTPHHLKVIINFIRILRNVPRPAAKTKRKKS